MLRRDGYRYEAASVLNPYSYSIGQLINLNKYESTYNEYVTCTKKPHEGEKCGRKLETF